MTEPKIEAIQNTCFFYHSANPNGIGGVLKGYVLDGKYKELKIDLAKGEMQFSYTNQVYIDGRAEFNSYIDWVNGDVPFYLPRLGIPEGVHRLYRRQVDLLKDKNLVYLRMCYDETPDFVFYSPVRIIDDERSIFYHLEMGGGIEFDAHKDTGIDIVPGNANGIKYINHDKNQYMRGTVQVASNLPAKRGAEFKYLNETGVLWRSNEFPYKNMTISIYSSHKHLKLFDTQVIFPIPAIAYTDQELSWVADGLSLSSYVSIDFNHDREHHLEDQKRILVVSYDGDNTGKAASFFDLNSLSYKEGYIYRNVTNLSEVQLDPFLVAKSKVITLSAFNGQSPFPGEGQLVVK